SEAGLEKIAAEWPMVKLIEIWNGLPAVTPVAKFKDRATAVSRIGKAIQSLTTAEPVIDAGPESEAPAVEDQISTDAPAECDTAPVADQTSTEEAPEGEADV